MGNICARISKEKYAKADEWRAGTEKERDSHGDRDWDRERVAFVAFTLLLILQFPCQFHYQQQQIYSRM